MVAAGGRTGYGAWVAIALAVAIGISVTLFNWIGRFTVSDPLVLALVAGIVVRSLLGDRLDLRRSSSLALQVLIPIGMVFYGLRNINLLRLAQIQSLHILLLVVVVLVYFLVILLLGRLLGQRRQITYLTAAGSAICGASAIIVTAPAVDADPDDVSISLLSVTLAALVALYLVFPFLGTLFELPARTYGLAAGALLQFTGFVKAAVADMPHLPGSEASAEVASLALSMKGGRYLVLLVAIPLFASLVRKRLYFPAVLWILLGGSLAGTLCHALAPGFYQGTLGPLVKPVYLLSWSVAMGAIGMSADIRQLLSDNGVRALGMAFAGFCAALATFFLGLYLLQPH